MSSLLLFKSLVALHILTGASGLVSFWVPVVGRKGGANLLLQVLLTLAAANCAWQGWKIGMPLMMGIAVIGFATVATNLRFILHSQAGPQEWLLEHVKALVGAGISVYTAFFAFGAVRLIPALALTPVLWSVPLVVGLTLIVYHQRRLLRGFARVA